MKKTILFVLIAIVLVLTACQSSQQSLQPTKQENVDFGRIAATEMVEKKERMIMDAASQGTFTKQEYDELEKAFTEEFGDRAQDFLSMLFITDLDAASDADRKINENMLYPTVFHEGVNLTSATVNKVEYEENMFNQTTLTVKEEYDGNDEKLQGWNREYIFEPDENEDWQLKSFSGTMNFNGEDYTMDDLELKS